MSNFLAICLVVLAGTTAAAQANQSFNIDTEDLSHPLTFKEFSRSGPHNSRKNCGTKPAMRRRGSNFLRKNGAPGAIPTRDLPLWRRTLYAAELREHM